MFLFLHGPVTNIQLDRCAAGTAHVAIGVGDEAAVLGTVAFSGHLHTEGVGGGGAADGTEEVFGLGRDDNRGLLVL